jgi:predicted metal-binding membrane protein
MFGLAKYPAMTRNALVWITFLTLALLAWIPTLFTTVGMLAPSASLLGTMGLSTGAFLFFWTIMMMAMMLPSLAPAASVRYEHLRQQTGGTLAFARLLVFLVGYLLIWALFGVPIFFLAGLGELLVLWTPLSGTIFGVGLLVAIGFYQMTPLQKQYLRHCNPTLCGVCQSSFNRTFFSYLREGFSHGLVCLGCCGGLMLVMVAVGLMNLPWMVLLTVLIFLEKTWRYGDRLGFYVGFGLLTFAALALAEPALLPGLFRPF